MADKQSSSIQVGSALARELGHELEKALKNLETYAESRDKRDYLTATRQLLGEIRGVLKLAGQQPLAMLAEDMGALLGQHMQRPEDDADPVLNLMAEGLLSLNAALSSGHYSLLNLIKLLNQVRMLTGAELASETTLFEPDIDRGLKFFGRSREARLDSAALRKIAALYQKLLPALVQGEVDADSLARAQQVGKALHQLSGHAMHSAIGYVVLVLLREYQAGRVVLDSVLVAQLQRFGVYLGRLAEDFAADDRGLLKNLLFCLLQAGQHSEAAEKLFRVFGLEQIAAQHQQTDQAGFDQRLVSQVAGELQKELNQTKLWLDDAVSGIGDFPQTVRQINGVFKRVADTMVMLGVTATRDSVSELHDRLLNWQDYDNISSVSAEDLQWFADHLVDLEQEVGHLSRAGSATEARQSNELNAAQQILIDEGRQTLDKAKLALNEFLASADVGVMSDTPIQLESLEGALRFYPLPRIADLVRSAGYFIGDRIVASGQRPAEDLIRQLADLLVAIDYYLECLQQGTAASMDFLVERAVQDCVQLGYPVDADFTARVAEIEAQRPAQPLPDEQAEVAAIQDEAEQLPEPDSLSVDTAHQTQSVAVESDDEDMLVVFAEEAEELLPEARENFASWCSGSTTALADLRRAFHTLKGGGRMVGASVVGELSWALENLLNRVMDGTVSAGPSVRQVVGDALDALPELLEAMQSGNADQESAEVAELRQSADLLANPSAVRSGLAADQRKASAVEATDIPIESQPEDDMPPSGQVEPMASEAPVEFAEPEAADAIEAQPLASELEQPATPDPLDILAELESQATATGNDPLHKAARSLVRLYEHFSFSGESVEESTSTLLTSLQELVARMADSSALDSLSQQATDMLAELEVRLVEGAQGDRIKRYRPLQRLLTQDLGTLLEFESLVADWQIGQLDSLRLQQALADLALLRAAAQRAQVEPIDQLSERLEQLVSGADASASLDQSTADLLRRAQDCLIGMLDSIASAERVVEMPETLAADLEIALQPAVQEEEQAPADVEATPEVADEYPAPSPEDAEGTAAATALAAEDDFDRELLDTFIEEAQDLQAEVGEGLGAWQAAPGQFEYADAIHRSLHTLKGGARLSGLENLGTMSHEFESLIIDRQVMRSVDAAFFEDSYRHYDRIVSEIERVKRILASGANLAELKAARKAPPVEAAMQVTPIAEPERPAPAVVEPEPEDSETVEAAGKERREQFRVEADLLDKMVNLAGEAIVFRGRIEAQVSGFDAVLDELESTTNRIQSLSRRLDGETQAQIAFRREQIAESGEEEDFDPLEMDRYSLLQQLSRQLIEATSDLQDLRATLSGNTREAKTLLLQNSRVQTELNDRLMDTRMVPFSRIVPRLQRMTRQIAGELNKKIRLDVGLVEGEMDRQVLDQILSPLEHILRNAIDHGIEADRLAAGKDSVGVIGLDVKRDGAHMVLRITDDGRGVDIDRVRQKAVENGLVPSDKAAAMDERALLDLIFAPGFSTARELTQISGRGVGMDVVRSKVRQLGGTVEIESEPGKGTSFKLYLPFTLSVNRALMVRIAEDIYALPLSSLEALVRISKDELAKYYADPERRLIYGPNRYRYGYLGEFLYTLAKPELESIDETAIPLVLFRSGEHAIAIQVDEILGSQEVVVKSLGRPLHDIPGLAGAAIMGDGSVVVTLDMFTLLQSYDRRHAADEEPQVLAADEAQAESRTPRIMVVDDSVTVRKVTSRFLTREGFQVETARDGVEALRQVHEQKPDLMLVDLEMPRMDGFELLGILRSNERFADLPVFIITSRTGEKHRERGLELGAQQYFGKPYREEEVLAAIVEVLDLDARRKFRS